MHEFHESLVSIVVHGMFCQSRCPFQDSQSTALKRGSDASPPIYLLVAVGESFGVRSVAAFGVRFLQFPSCNVL